MANHPGTRATGSKLVNLQWIAPVTASKQMNVFRSSEFVIVARLNEQKRPGQAVLVLRSFTPYPNLSIF